MYIVCLHSLSILTGRSRLLGDVYLGINILTGDLVAIKLEPVNTNRPRLRREWTAYKTFGQSPGIPRALWFGTEHQHNALVMDLLGPSLETVHRAFNHRFSLKTVLMIGIQLVRQLINNIMRTSRI